MGTRRTPAAFRMMVSACALAAVFGVSFFVAQAAENPFNEARTQVTNVAKGAGTEAGVQEYALEDMIGKIIKGAISLIGVIFFAYMVWAGYLWMTAHGEAEKIEQAKKMLMNAIIGLAVTLAAYAITNFVMNATRS